MRPERRCKSGMDGGLRAAVLPAAPSKNGRHFVQPMGSTSYFYVMKNVTDAQLSHDAWWPFDEEGEPLPNWHLD
jgi:hypothetical protein